MENPNVWNEQLFCRMVKYYTKIFNLPPLAAKIYSYLIFDVERKGKTFDELVDVFSASKSSVSTSLNLLLSNKLINDQNKLDERKRYFMINHNLFKVRLMEIVDLLQEELYIINELEKYIVDSTENDRKKSEIYKDLLNKNIYNIISSLTKL